MSDLFKELRRLAASYLVRFALNVTPKEDIETLKAFYALFNAMLSAGKAK